MKKGFTLIELMVALTLFIAVMTMSMNSILGVFNADRRSRSLKTVLNNLNLAVESMSKEMRFGRNYHCGIATPVTSPLNCAGGDTFVSFLASNGSQITYRLTGTAIEKQIGSAGYIAVTAPEILIDSLTFYVLGAANTDTLQPKMVMKIKSHSGTGIGRSDFTLETLISQRSLDR